MIAGVLRATALHILMISDRPDTRTASIAHEQSFQSVSHAMFHLQKDSSLIYFFVRIF